MMLAARPATVVARQGPRRTVVAASAQAPQQPPAPVNRRAAAATLLGLAALPLLLAAPAQAKDVKEAARAAEERKRKLKEAAKAMAEKGKGEAVFTTSRYGVEEGANARS